MFTRMWHLILEVYTSLVNAGDRVSFLARRIRKLTQPFFTLLMLVAEMRSFVSSDMLLGLKVSSETPRVQN